MSYKLTSLFLPSVDPYLILKLWQPLGNESLGREKAKRKIRLKQEGYITAVKAGKETVLFIPWSW